ncbi:rhodanese-like domain-containing protein [Martelella sp. FLE1502]
MTGRTSLCSPAWLRAHLGAPNLRIFDCSVRMYPQPVGKSLLVSGRDDWARAHIPGARFLSMPDDLSAPRPTVPYGLPEADRVQTVLRREGLRNDDVVVLYGNGYPGPVVRTWWVLIASGAGDVRILDGGFEGWCAAGLPITDADASWPEGDFAARPVAALRADAAAVNAAIGDPGTALVNALSPEQFTGDGGAHYGRPGRIPGSVSVPFRALMYPNGAWFRSPDEIADIFDHAGVLACPRIISYCGGGIAASGTTFALHLIGRRDAALYDGSLTDWSADPGRPMVVGRTGGPD